MSGSCTAASEAAVARAPGADKLFVDRLPLKALNRGAAFLFAVLGAILFLQAIA